ncbi:hypothetical protein [Luteitalea sp.]|uniref:hypothetical protein n=1 Tax=Luteitalea sp. TaxID=2004800 RepID=UPI0025BD0893|nr:hypothetical protein [Luteitalea sp.]
MALATAMPMAMIAPMNDCTFKLVPVMMSISSTPTRTRRLSPLPPEGDGRDDVCAARQRSHAECEGATMYSVPMIEPAIHPSGSRRVSAIIPGW